MTLIEAKGNFLLGWNIRCNLCGEHPAEWINDSRFKDGVRPNWGSLALCLKHKKEFDEEMERHEKEINRLQVIILPLGRKTKSF